MSKPRSLGGHYLRKIVSHRSPSFMASFATVDIRAEKDAKRKNGVKVCPTAWALNAWKRHGKEWLHCEFSRGENLGQCLHAIGELGKLSDNVLVFSHNTLHSLATIGLWQAIDDMEWLIEYGSEGEDGKEKGHKPFQRSHGPILLDPPTIVSCRQTGEKATITFVDIRNYGIPLLEGVNEYAGSGMIPSFDADSFSNRPMTAAISRANAIGRFAIQLADEVAANGWGPFSKTISSQATKAFRAKHMRSPILVHKHEPAIKLEREAYHSGRVECYRIGRIRNEVVNLDVSACYPAVARSSSFPVRMARFVTGGSCDPLPWIEKGWHVIARVVVDTDKPYYPLRTDYGTIYPIGLFETSLPGPELQLAIDSGHVRDVIKFAVYEPSRIFTSYVDDLAERSAHYKMAGMNAMRTIVKRMMQSVWGKFSERFRPWIFTENSVPPAPWAIWTENDPESGEVINMRAIGMQVEYQGKPVEGDNSMPAISAWVTSLARIKLLEYLEIAGRENCYYCDTDCIFTNKETADSLERGGHVRNGEMGFLSIKSRFEWLEIRSPKNYEAPGKIVHCGIPIACDRSGEWSWTYTTTESFESCLRSHRMPGVGTVTVTRSDQGKYRGGIVRDNGIVEPIHVYMRS